MAEKDVQKAIEMAEQEAQHRKTDFSYQIFWLIFFFSVFIIAAFGLIAEQ